MAKAQVSPLDEARKLVADIEAVVVPTEHRYAGMVTTKLNEAKTWATKMVEELAGKTEQAAPADTATGADTSTESENTGADQDTQGEGAGEGDKTPAGADGSAK